jgi:uncharacterized membrane protein
MNMNAARFVTATAVSAALSPAFAASASADTVPTYNIVDLGIPSPNTLSRSSGISDSGEYVVGQGAGGGAGIGNNAYLWQTGLGQSTLTPSARNNWALGVNDSGAAVGITSATAQAASDGSYLNSAPVLWKNGTATLLAAEGRAYAINNAGIAVGSSGTVDSATQRAVIYDTNAGTTSTITATSAAGGTMKSALDINSSGLIIGTGTQASDAGNIAVTLAYNSVTGTMSTIAAAQGTSGVTVTDVNNNGMVVGYYGDTSVPGTLKPYAWSESTGLLDVALPSGMVSGVVTGINDQGWIVGYARNGKDASNYAFVDIAGTSYLLSDLVKDLTGWDLAKPGVGALQIAGIANDGTIIGSTKYNDGTTNATHSFALQVTAVPEPSSYALLLAGIAAGGFVARRRKAANKA